MANTWFEIPLNTGPQKTQVTLLGLDYTLVLTWCDAMNAWRLDLLDGDSSPLVTGIPFLPAVDLLAQYVYLTIGGILYVVSDLGIGVVPDFNALGTTCHLYFVVQT